MPISKKWCPQISYVEDLTASSSECDFFWDRVFKELTKLKWGNECGS